MLHFVSVTNAVLSGNRGLRYRLPSGVYSDFFLRVGSIQTSQHVLNAVFFWMLPFLKTIRGVLIDTWSIASIALNAGRLLPIYDNTTEHLRIEMLSHYLDGRPGTRSELTSIARGVSSDFANRFLVLFSASMTGQSLTRLARSLENAGCPGEQVESLVLYRLGSAPLIVGGHQVPELCDFSPEVHPLKVNPPRVASGKAKATVAIDPNTYFPLIVHEREQRIRKTVASLNKQFFDSYRGTHAIRIHANAYVGGQKYRHHGVLIDLLEMLGVSAFEQKLRFLIESLQPRPRLILFPPHEAGTRMARKIRSSLHDDSISLFSSLDLSDSSILPVDPRADGQAATLGERLATLSISDAIMVVDDVITTGQRVRTFQRRIREFDYGGRIYYLVGVARMESRSMWEELNSTLALNEFGDSHRVMAVEKLTLPDWSEDTCPWCVEGRILDDIIRVNQDKVSRAMTERATLLRNANREGLGDFVFVEALRSPAMTLRQTRSFFARQQVPPPWQRLWQLLYRK